MRPASVGFQCPECVKEGARSTRAGRTPYGGLRVSNPALTTVALILANVVIYLAELATGGPARGTLVEKLALLPRTSLGLNQDGVIKAFEGVSGGAWWQPLTSMFLHESVLHIGFNMVALYFLGPQLELVLGRARYLALYFLSGLAGSLVVMWLGPSNAQTLGASGAIFGLLGALLIVALKVHANIQQLLFWIGINVVFTVTDSNVSWEGHLGGFVGGALLAALIVYAPKARRAQVQWAGMTVFGVATIALIAVRAMALG